ncbi:MAG: otsB [Betaproteobacteria bacterium]|nr:otsB [Betaproteobacteria bacterium]
MAASREARRPPPPAPAAHWALFLDVDGCLLDLADTPDAVIVPPSLHDTLRVMSDRLEGALALVSGRSLASVDRLFTGRQWPASGLHGLERRTATHLVSAPPAPPHWPAVRDEARRLADNHRGTLFEDKGAALALHWRTAPQAGTALRAFAEAMLPRLPGYCLQRGHDVVELRPDAGDKGTAIVAFLEDAPFRGRVPVFVGDDITDESGFAVVNARNGISILVGPRAHSCAHYALTDPAAVRAWLAHHPEQAS